MLFDINYHKNRDCKKVLFYRFCVSTIICTFTPKS